MQKDFVLIRKLLQFFADKPEQQVITDPIQIGLYDYSHREILYHLVLLTRNGFLDGTITITDGKPKQILDIQISALTLRGLEMLEKLPVEDSAKMPSEITVQIGEVVVETALNVGWNLTSSFLHGLVDDIN